MNKTAIKNFAVWARRKLIGEITDKARLLGVTEVGVAEPLSQSTSENPGKLEPDFVTTPFDTDLEFTSNEQNRVMQLKDENKLDELFRMLFIKQRNKLHKILPELFEATSDYTELLLTISFTDKNGVVYHLTHDIPECDFDIEHTDEDGKTPCQIEIIGWMYQYYNIEPKDKVFSNLKKNIKICKENIPAATQLFTPDWIVRYMVENSLGRLWVEGHSNDTLKAGWKYYLEKAEQESDVQAQLSKIREDYAKLTPEDIKIIEEVVPCLKQLKILCLAEQHFRLRPRLNFFNHRIIECA